ncbi:MAG: hypothetical protein AAGG38_10480 [Planctomycetota bacterium]
MTDFDSDELITFGDAVRYLIATGHPVSRPTVHNWHHRGVVIDGYRHKLNGERHGKRMFTTPADLDRFVSLTSRHRGRNGRARLADR